MIITLVFKKNANVFAENWQKSRKIVIITSTDAATRNQRAVFKEGYADTLLLHKLQGPML
jgi:hypothetical protein